MTTIRIAILIFAVLILVVALSLVAVRVVRTTQERYRQRLAAGPRRALLAFVAEGGEEGSADLLAIPPRAWRAAEPTAVALLGKVRGEAHSALAEVFDRRGIIGRTVTQLSHRNPVRRARAAELLGHLRRADAVAPLCRLLGDPVPEVRVVAVRALGAIGDPAAAGPLLDALVSHVPSQMVADALSRIGQGALPALHDALRHPDPLVKVTALEAIGMIGATGSVDAVADVLRERTHPAVRVAAATAVGRLGGRAALAPLLAAVQPGNPTALRQAAARALGEVGAPTTGPTLAALLTDPTYRVAHEAARALVRLGPPGLAHLHAIADDPARGGRSGDVAAGHAHEALALAALMGG